MSKKRAHTPEDRPSRSRPKCKCSWSFGERIAHFIFYDGVELAGDVTIRIVDREP